MVEIQTKSQRGFWYQFGKLGRARIGLALVLFMLGIVMLAPLLTSIDPLTQFRDGLTPNGLPLPPGSKFIMGTDQLGRDMFSRLLYGGRVSLLVSFIANLTAAVLGTSVGLLAGYYTGILDSMLMRITDVMLAFPAILLALGLGSVLRPSMQTVIIILSVVTWPTLARLVRGQVLVIRDRTFVESARAAGASDWYIIWTHILPHTITVTVVWASLSFASAVLIESSLSFLGVGIPLPTASWGNMIAEGQSRYRSSPWMILEPTAAILMTTFGFNLLGDAVRDALDPHTSQRLS
jgi:peptide/nickel transport system permease protein